MRQSIVRFFAPPAFAGDEAMTRQARVLFTLLATDSLIIAMGVLATLTVVVNKTAVGLVFGALLTRLLIARALAGRGQVWLASWVWAGGMWLITTLVVVLSGHLGTTLVTFPLAMAVITGILLGPRPAVLLTALSCLVFLGVALFELTGAAPLMAFPGPPIVQWVVLLMAFIFTIVPLLLTLQGLNAALALAQKTEQRYATLFEAAPAMALILREQDGAALVAACNDTFLRTLGYRREQVLGQNLARFYPPASATAREDIRMPRPAASHPVSIERELVAADGRLIPTLLQVAPERDAAGQVTGVLALYVDITARKQAELGMRRLSRTYQVLSEVNAAIVRVRDPQALLETACRIAVEHGDFRMAWVGLVDPQARRVRPTASAGMTAHYLERLNIDLDDPARSRGPTATAARTGVHRVANNIAHDPQMAPWRDDALVLGYQSSAAFPLIVAGTVAGVLNLYSPEPDCFDAAELRLYDEMALDISFALEASALEEQRKQLEQAQQERLKELTCLRQVQRHLERNLALDELGPRVVADLAVAMQYPEITVARLELDGRCYGADLAGLPPGQRLSTELRVGGLTVGRLAVGYREPRPFSIPEEQNLLDGVAHSLGLWLERCRAEEALTQERNTLAQRVEQRTAELSRLNAELERAVRAKDEFLANMSHELRTPLTAILGLSESLQEQYRGPLNDQQQEMVGRIDASGRHLLSLINDILDLSKVEAGRLELQHEAVAIAEVCQASLLFVKEQAAKRRLQVGFQLDDETALINADPRRLKQILVNLLSNAVKFTEPGGRVSLEVSTDPAAGVITFAVQDNGIGISSEELARLFTPFTQVDSRLSRQQNGTGLGLALVRRLAELHGGSVTVESEPGVGSRFTVALPAPSPRGVAAKPPAKAAGRVASLRSAFVVEDSTVAYEQIGRYLQELGIEPFVYDHGEGAPEKIAALRPDVIILDLQMPGLSGWNVLAQLKASPELGAIPVVIVSVLDERARGLAAGAVEYLVKPLTREGLRQALEVAAGSREPAPAAPSGPPAPAQEALGARLLLAEDNEFNILAIGDYLQEQGYKLTVARNGSEALALAPQVCPDLILMDIQMPELDGLEATRRLRALPAFARTPIIALTALAMPGDRERCLEAGADEYLTKPVKLKSLAETVRRLLESHRTTPRPASAMDMKP